MHSSDQHIYVLRGGDQGAERLRLLAEVKWPTTKSLLEKVGLRRDKRCLDVGCGTGAVTIRMGECVGPNGHVVGIDLDERCLEVARQEAKRRELPVTFRVGNASEIQEASVFDLVFGRFVLTHLRQPEQALKGMVKAVQPGSVVVVEDIQFSGHFCHPACNAFDRYVTLYQAVVRKNGGDPNIGPRLPSMFMDVGLTDIELEVIQPTYRHGPGKQISTVTMEHIRESVILGPSTKTGPVLSGKAEPLGLFGVAQIAWRAPRRSSHARQFVE